MVSAEKAGLLNEIINKNDDYFYFSQSDESREENEIFPQLLAVMKKHYSEKYLLATIEKAQNNRWHFSINRFVQYMNEELKGNK